jgi:hypothetical protein
MKSVVDMSFYEEGSDRIEDKGCSRGKQCRHSWDSDSRM